MTVKQLIAQLRKMPSSAEVYLRDHDQSDWEYNGAASIVELVDYDDLPCDKDGFYKQRAIRERFYHPTPIVIIQLG